MEAKGLSLDKGKPIIFISHRSTDKELADRLAEFFYGTEIPRGTVFCSSLPGNDVNEKISHEVKTAIKNSAINIVILSRDYYQSAYCLNEAGILWYRDDVKVVPIALPEINYDSMYGFLGNEYKLRRLDSSTDVSYIYDAVREAVSVQQAKFSVIALESNKLMKRYAAFLQTRETPETEPAVLSTDDTESKAVSAVSGNQDTANEAVSESQTRTDAIISESNELEKREVDLLDAIGLELIGDDERVILYYILKKDACRASKEEIYKWQCENEIYDVDVDDAFDQLSFFDGVTVTDDMIEITFKASSKYTTFKLPILSALKECVIQHKKLTRDIFNYLWKTDKMLNPVLGLFIAYIIDEGIQFFRYPDVGNRQIKSIERWQRRNLLGNTLSNNYGMCIDFFIENGLVYERNWADHEYYLFPSLEKLLMNNSEPYRDYLKKCKRLERWQSFCKILKNAISE